MLRKLCVAGAVIMLIFAVTLEIAGRHYRIPSVEDLAELGESNLTFSHDITVPTGVEGESLVFSYWAMKGYQGVVSFSGKKRTGPPSQPWFSVSDMEGKLKPGNPSPFGVGGPLHVGTLEDYISLGRTTYLHPMNLDDDGETEVFIHQEFAEPVTRAGYIRPGTYILDYTNAGWALRPYRSWKTLFWLESRRRGVELRLVLAAVALIVSLVIGEPRDRWKAPTIGLAAALGFLFFPCGILCPVLILLLVILGVFVWSPGWRDRGDQAAQSGS